MTETMITNEAAELRSERCRLRQSICKELREGICHLETVRLLVIGGQSADLRGFDWATLQADLCRLGALDRRLGREGKDLGAARRV
jgi:hypothetical protein